MEAGQGPVKATPGYAWAPHSAIARPPLQDYNPITLTLADALQLLATKSRWSTARKDRKAALQSLEAAMDAGQPAAGREKRPVRHRRGSVSPRCARAGS